MAVLRRLVEDGRLFRHDPAATSTVTTEPVRSRTTIDLMVVDLEHLQLPSDLPVLQENTGAAVDAPGPDQVQCGRANNAYVLDADSLRPPFRRQRRSPGSGGGDRRRGRDHGRSDGGGQQQQQQQEAHMQNHIVVFGRTPARLGHRSVALVVPFNLTIAIELPFSAEAHWKDVVAAVLETAGVARDVNATLCHETQHAAWYPDPRDLTKPRLFPIVRLTLRNAKEMSLLENACAETLYVPSLGGSVCVQVHETMRVEPPHLRFTSETGVRCGTWLRVDLAATTAYAGGRMTWCDVEALLPLGAFPGRRQTQDAGTTTSGVGGGAPAPAPFVVLPPEETATLACPLNTLSWDIETVAGTKAEVDEARASGVKRYATPTVASHLVSHVSVVASMADGRTLRTVLTVVPGSGGAGLQYQCPSLAVSARTAEFVEDPVQREMVGTYVRCDFASEAVMFAFLRHLIVYLDADTVLTYNGHMYDWMYVAVRAARRLPSNPEIQYRELPSEVLAKLPVFFELGRLVHAPWSTARCQVDPLTGQPTFEDTRDDDDMAAAPPVYRHFAVWRLARVNGALLSPDMPGRTSCDLLRVLKSFPFAKPASMTLGSVAKFALGERGSKFDMDYDLIPVLYYSDVALDNTRLVEYALGDSVVTLMLFDHYRALGLLLQIGNVMYVGLNSIVNRGTVERAHGVMIGAIACCDPPMVASLQPVHRIPFEGGHVFQPCAGSYGFADDGGTTPLSEDAAEVDAAAEVVARVPAHLRDAAFVGPENADTAVRAEVPVVACLDFNSLYPSTMMEGDISSDTMIVDPWMVDKKRLNRAHLYERDVALRTGADPYGANASAHPMPYQPMLYDYQALKQSIPDGQCGYVHTEHEALYRTVACPPARSAKAVAAARRGLVPRAVHEHGFVVCLSQSTRGVLARLEEMLVNERKVFKDVKARAKAANNAYETAAADARQLALKFSGNSVYGAQARLVLASPLVAIATTAIGRCAIQRVARLVEETDRIAHLVSPAARQVLEGAFMHVVYGDTDSVMVSLFDRATRRPVLRDNATMFHLYEEVARVLTQHTFGGYGYQVLEMEKLMYGAVFIKRKFYTCVTRDAPGPGPRKQLNKGLSVTRSDGTRAMVQLLRALVDLVGTCVGLPRRTAAWLCVATCIDFFERMLALEFDVDMYVAWIGLSDASKIGRIKQKQYHAAAMLVNRGITQVFSGDRIGVVIVSRAAAGTASKSPVDRAYPVQLVTSTKQVDIGEYIQAMRNVVGGYLQFLVPTAVIDQLFALYVGAAGGHRYPVRRGYPEYDRAEALFPRRDGGDESDKQFCQRVTRASEMLRVFNRSYRTDTRGQHRPPWEHIRWEPTVERGPYLPEGEDGMGDCRGRHFDGSTRVHCGTQTYERRLVAAADGGDAGTAVWQSVPVVKVPQPKRKRAKVATPQQRVAKRHKDDVRK